MHKNIGRTSKLTKLFSWTSFDICPQILYILLKTVIFAVTDSWKLHYTTPRFLKGTTKCGFVCTCWGDGNVDHHDPPLLFNLAHDPSEDHPLDPTLPKHQAIIEHVAKEVAAFEATVESVPSQFTLDKLLPRPWLQEYCKFPTYYCWLLQWMA